MIAALAVLAPLAACAHSSRSRPSGADPGYPRENVLCATVDGAAVLDSADFTVLLERARALGLRPVSTTYVLQRVTPAGTSGASASVQTILQSRVAISAAGTMHRLTHVCASGPGQPSAPMRLVDDTMSYGPQPVPAWARTQDRIAPELIETFVARRYHATHVECDDGANLQLQPGLVNAGTVCTSPERRYDVRIKESGRTFEVDPEWRVR